MTQVIVTDHALVRYIERVYGLDLSKLRTEISDAVKVAAAVGASCVTYNTVEFRLAPHRDNPSAIAVTTIVNRALRIGPKPKSKDRYVPQAVRYGRKR